MGIFIIIVIAGNFALGFALAGWLGMGPRNLREIRAALDGPVATDAAGGAEKEEGSGG